MYKGPQGIKKKKMKLEVQTRYSGKNKTAGMLIIIPYPYHFEQRILQYSQLAFSHFLSMLPQIRQVHLSAETQHLVKNLHMTSHTRRKYIHWKLPSLGLWRVCIMSTLPSAFNFRVTEWPYSTMNIFQTSEIKDLD